MRATILRLLALAAALWVTLLQAPPTWAADVAAAFQAFRRGDYDRAFIEFKALAEGGDKYGQYNLAVFYTDDSLGVPQDYAQAARWYRRAAQQGHVEAQFKLAVMYIYGYGVPVDRHKTIYWFFRSALEGHIDAQYNLGFMYRNGLDLKANDAEAARWFRRAAEQGSPNAQAALGVMYAKGEGVRRDEIEALRWLSRAAARDHERARENRAVLLRRMLGVRHGGSGYGLGPGREPVDGEPITSAFR